MDVARDHKKTYKEFDACKTYDVLSINNNINRITELVIILN